MFTFTVCPADSAIAWDRRLSWLSRLPGILALSALEVSCEAGDREPESLMAFSAEVAPELLEWEVDLLISTEFPNVTSRTVAPRATDASWSRLSVARRGTAPGSTVS